MLPEASLGFRSILLQICFVNQAFLEFQFFQVQGRNQAFLGNQFFQVQGSNQAFAVVRMDHYILNFLFSIQIFSRKDDGLRCSFDMI